MFVQTTNRFESEIYVEKNGDTVDGKSIMGMMMLAAAYGTKIKVKASGPDYEEALREIERLIENKFGEEE
jgi:phosphocarrier protein